MYAAEPNSSTISVMSELKKDGHQRLPDSWGSASAVYASRAEHVTRPPAEDLISWINSKAPFSAADAIVLDNGCGTGVLTTTLSIRFPNLPIVAADVSPGMLETIKQKQLANVQTRVQDAINLNSISNDTFTHVLSTFMVQFTSDPLQALREMYRVTKKGGTFGLGMWGELCFDVPWEDACRTFEPGYVYPKPWTSDWSDDEKIRSYLELVGFKEIEVKTVRPRWDFESTEAYCKYYFESGNPYFERAYGPWRDAGKLGDVKQTLERIVRENYNEARDFNMEVFLFVAKK